MASPRGLALTALLPPSPGNEDDDDDDDDQHDDERATGQQRVVAWVPLVLTRSQEAQQWDEQAPDAFHVSPPPIRSATPCHARMSADYQHSGRWLGSVRRLLWAQTTRPAIATRASASFPSAPNYPDTEPRPAPDYPDADPRNRPRWFRFGTIAASGRDGDTVAQRTARRPPWTRKPERSRLMRRNETLTEASVGAGSVASRWGFRGSRTTLRSTRACRGGRAVRHAGDWSRHGIEDQLREER